MRKSKVTGIIGLGYVGLPLLLDFCDAGIKTIGFDLDQKKIEMLRQGQSYISYIQENKISDFISRGQFLPTDDFSRLQEVENIIITVPTPLNESRDPDLSFVKNTVKTISNNLQVGQLVILESTTYPGTSREVILPLLEQTGMKVGKDFYLAYSPERVDPNNESFAARDIPKVVGGLTNNCLEKIKELYSKVFYKLVPVSSVEVSEASKLLENIFRSVNVAMINEMKLLFDRMGIDVWEVIEASASKPFGFMPFYPGPGLGGHCLPIDPFYLAWKARQYDFTTRFIELAGEINITMPYYVVRKTVDALNWQGKSIKGSHIFLLGVAYKKDVDDIRESPAVKIITLLQEKGANVCYHDPYINVIEGMRSYPNLLMESEKLDEQTLEQADIVLIITDHSNYNYEWILKYSSLIVDTRNVIRNCTSSKVIKA